jgi:CRP-like cAMP-binding protein
MSKLLRQHIEVITGNLTNTEFDNILSHFKKVRINKNELLVKRGDLVENEFWVIQGCLKASFTEIRNREYIQQFAIEDWWISDYQAFLNQTRATTDVTCLEDCTLLAISLKNRESLCNASHKMEHFWRVKLDKRFVAMQRRVDSLLQHTAQERYENFLVRHPKLVQRVPRHELAAYLGVSRESLRSLPN